MTSRLLRCAAALALVVPLAACEAQKSSNPLSPSVAGPIAGVSIGAPGMVQPAQGFKFKPSEQPIRLVVANASTNGVRPLTYTFEVATDSGFTNKVFARSGVAPGDNNQTSVQVDQLPIGQAYSWRARAEDGANTGPFATSSFEIYPNAAVSAPVAVSPVNDADAGSTTPTLVAHNAAIVGPVGYLGYEFQVATDQAFTHLIAAGIVNEGAGDTSFNSSPLPGGTTFYWRVRASDGQTTSAWSTVQVFHTPAIKPPPPPPPPTGGAGDWQSCAAYTDKTKLSTCVHDAVNPAAGSAAAAFEVTKRVAWLLRGEGAGLLIKNGGENIVSWQGYSFAAGRICYPDGHIYKVVSDVGGSNGPSWSDNGFVDKSLYVPAIDPSK